MSKSKGGGGRSSGRQGGGGGGSNNVGDYKTFSNEDDADRFANTQLGRVERFASQSEVNALVDYSGDAYLQINKELRSGRVLNSRDYIDAIDRAMARPDAVTKENFTAMRGFHPDFFAGAKPGDVLIDRGYSSTSINPNHSWYGSAARVLIPKGTRGIYLERITENPGEYEFLLNRGTRFEVVSNKPGNIVVKVIQ